MADCRELEPLFAAYVDGEAAECDCAALDAHFRKCPPCRSRIEAERIVKEAVATGASAGPRANVFARRTWVPLSMVATVVLTVAGVFIYSLKDGTEALAAQLAVDHVKCFEFASPPVIIPDAKLLSREWAEARGWAVKVPESEPVEQLELLGIRRCISTEGTTAHLMYKWRGQPLSVYVLNSEDPRVSSTPRLVERFGQEELIWSKKGRTYAVVAQARRSEIEHMALYVQRVAE